MSILITGGSGLIGASLTRMIVELGERPAIFDVAPSPPILKKLTPSLNIFKDLLIIYRERAQSEWEWKTSFSLPEMVDDFIEEFNQNRSFYL